MITERGCVHGTLVAHSRGATRMDTEQKKERIYIAIDLKSFYASVECVQRGLDPLTTNLVVADASRTEKTICLAVSPALKNYGIPGRARLFEVNQKVRDVNRERLVRLRRKAGNPGKDFSGSSSDARALQADSSLAVSFVTAVPQMAKYIQISTEIYGIYLKYIAPEDIHVYSIDEVFMDVTGYLGTYGLSAHELAMKMIREVLRETGITATAGIGTNLYLSKIAMDIVAKHIPADKNGVRIAELDEMSYRRALWTHRPRPDLWRVGRGYALRRQEVGLETMGDIARCSLGGPGDFYNEDLLYRMFGVNAELLIDHAWGWEPCTMADIKAYRPQPNSLGAGQVLMAPYDFAKAEVIVREMAEELSLNLVEKGLVTDQIVLDVGYDTGNLADPGRKSLYRGPVAKDHYGRRVPKPAHGSWNLGEMTSSTSRIEDAAVSVYRKITDMELMVRRVTITAAHVVTEQESRAEKQKEPVYEQLDLFTDYSAKEEEKKQEKERLEKERRLQNAVIDIKKKFGKNAIVRGTSYEDGATGRQRNGQIGGHKA